MHKPQPLEILTPRARLTVAICFVAAVLDGFDLSAPAVTAQQLRESFGLSAGQLGGFFSAGTFGLMLGSAVGGVMSDRVGRRATLVLSTILYGLGALANALAPSVVVLFLARMLTGIGLGATLPIVVTIAAEAVPERYRGRAITLIAAGAGGGGALVSLLGLWSAVLADWRVLYFIGAAGPVLLIPLLLLLPRYVPYAQELEGRGSILPLFASERRINTIVLWVMALSLMISVYILSNWLPSLLQSRGLDHVSTVRVQFVFSLVGIIGSLITGFLLDLAPRGRAISVTAIFGCFLLAVVAIARVPVHSPLVYVAGAAMGVMVNSTCAVLYGIAPRLYPEHIRGTGVGIALSVGRIGSIIGPLLAGMLLVAGFSASTVLLTMLPMMVISGGCAVFVSGKYRNDGKPLHDDN